MGSIPIAMEPSEISVTACGCRMVIFFVFYTLEHMDDVIRKTKDLSVLKSQSTGIVFGSNQRQVYIPEIDITIHYISKFFCLHLKQLLKYLFLKGTQEKLPL